MTQEHPITPPPELVMQWLEEGPEDFEFGISQHIATQAARWGADQELLACGKYLEQCAAWKPEDMTELYNYRRPKPPSLKEQALALISHDSESQPFLSEEGIATIRRALESLPS